MIQGTITSARAAEVTLEVRGADAKPEQVDAVIDTGFNGHLTLPSSRVARLALTYHSETTATLGDGTEAPLRKYHAQVLWEGVPRDVMVLEAEGGALIGMALLYGSRVTLDVVDGGAVTIAELP